MRSPRGVDDLGRSARDVAGEPTLAEEDVIALVRRHVDLEKVRTTDHDAELWDLWREEVRRATPDDHNADVLDRVMEPGPRGRVTHRWPRRRPPGWSLIVASTVRSVASCA